METKKRYSDEELEEFRTIVNDKLAIAKSDYDETMKILMNKNTNDVNDTSPTYKALEEGSSNQTKEELVQMAQRQQKFIQALQAALVRINNKTYGIDRITGELIPKERLRVVPHATLSVASKMANKKSLMSSKQKNKDLIATLLIILLILIDQIIKVVCQA